MPKTVVAAALGECVHVAGIMNFLRLAETAGWKTIFLGPAVNMEEIILAAKRENADLVGISYRLTPETGEQLLGQFAEAADELHSAGVRFAFGGTPPVAERAKNLGFFERVFDGSETPDETLAFLKGNQYINSGEVDYPQTLIKRIQWKAPFPILRHHFGLPTIQATLEGIKNISKTGVLDVISLGTDQDAQENFFHPERQNSRQKGAGGVPVRSANDFCELFTASRFGNYPLMRTYSGTDDFIQLAELVTRTMHNAWCAIPLFWFNRMDGRGPWDLAGSIQEHQKVMSWYGKRGIPVEINEPHHWGMRDSSDVIYVVTGFLAAYNAKAFGVQDYIAQFMFNSPPGMTTVMDLAKMLAILELIEPLASPNFRIWKQTRTGLLSYPLEPSAARAHLASTVYVQMGLKPNIVHVVGYNEADHAATAEDVIESCRLARKAIENALDIPDPAIDNRVKKRVAELVREANVTLRAIAVDGNPNSWIDPNQLTKAVTSGILDAPHLRSNPYARGQIRTQIIDGACQSISKIGKPISENERLNSLRME